MWMAYEDDDIWQVREVPPWEFKELAPAQLIMCYWRQQDALGCATVNNEKRLRRLHRSTEALKAALAGKEAPQAAFQP